MKKIITRTLIGATLVFMFIIPAFLQAPPEGPLYEHGNYTISKNEGRNTVPAAGSIGDRLDTYLYRLVWIYECAGECRETVGRGDDFKILDSNKKYSYGCLQFQQETWIAKAKQYGLDPWENGGIQNCDNQWYVARAMFLDDPVEASSHWYTSIYVRGLGLPEIKK